MMTGDGEDDPIWEAFVDAALPLGQVHERRSCYGDKPALYLRSREIAHCESVGVIDLRVTTRGWADVCDRFTADPAVQRNANRRDWIELHLHSASEVVRLQPLIASAIAANQ